MEAGPLDPLLQRISLVGRSLEIFNQRELLVLAEPRADTAGPLNLICPPMTFVAVARDCRVECQVVEAGILGVAQLHWIILAGSELERRRARLAEEVVDGPNRTVV